MKRIVQLITGPVLFAIAFLIPLNTVQCSTIGIIAWMIAWWISRPVPIGATSLLPMILFPMTGVGTLKEVATNYAHPIIYLFFGGFILGLAIEKWSLHRRFSLNILKRSGNNPKRIIMAGMLATAIMSMWISNTASTLMMLPIGMSMIELLESRLADKGSRVNFGICLLLGLAFAANIGGMTTLIGTPPNLVLAAFTQEALGIEIGFSTWFVMALPLVIMLFTLAYLVLTKLIFPIQGKPIMGVKELVHEEIGKLGKPGIPEKRVQYIFLGTALLWIFRGQLNKLPGFDFLNDSIIAILSAVTLFVIPDGQGRGLMNWSDTKKLPWDILLLFGGGLSIAAMIKASGLVEEVGGLIGNGESLQWLLLILLLTAMAVFLTEGMSNLALVSVLIPILFTVAPLLGGDPLELAIPVTLGASCAFMLPIATPPNAIVFSSERISMSNMIRAGFVMNLICIIIITIWTILVVPLLF
jgi:sodium-dependent dicarboxylate transporter 2/3/5